MTTVDPTKVFHMQVLEERDKTMHDLVANTRAHAMRDGALPAKVKALMAMLGDAMNHRPGGAQTLGNIARGLGATEDEVLETAEVAFWLGGIHAYNTAAEAFRK